MTKFWAVAAVAILVAGCGSITRGTSEDVAINSTPIGVPVTTDIGMSCTAPCTLKVPRNKDFTITASAPGYKTSTLKVGRKVSGGGAAGMAGNVVLGGIIGIAVDAGTGAAMDHTPNPAFIVLEAESQQPGAARRRLSKSRRRLRPISLPKLPPQRPKPPRCEEDTDVPERREL